MFESLVKKHFDFLKREYSFEENPHTFGYKKGAIELEFYHGRGELDICFFIRKTDDVFKAYISRSFDLLSVLSIEKKSAIVFPENLKGYITTEDDMDNYLEFLAREMKKHCVKQLEGDMGLFEELHLKRKE